MPYSFNAARTFAFILLASFLWIVPLNAQEPTTVSAGVPALVNFSGKAVDEQGKPIAGTVGVSFAIYKNQSEPAPLWTEAQNVNADAKGNYTARLGAGTPQGL